MPFDETEDPYAAPSRYTGDDPARPWSLRRAWQNSMWVYLVGLPFLLLSIPSITENDPSPSVLLLRIALVLTIAVGVRRRGLGGRRARCVVRWAYVGGFVALVGASAGTWGWEFADYGVYVAILVATLMPWPQSRIAIVGLGLVLVARLGRLRLGRRDPDRPDRDGHGAGPGRSGSSPVGSRAG